MRGEYNPEMGWFHYVLVALLLLGLLSAIVERCEVSAQMNREVHMRTITKYNSVSDQLIDEIDSIEGMWKRYATAQRVFARAHNREQQINDINEQDNDRLVRLSDTAIIANEQLVLLLLDVVEQLKQQATLTHSLSRSIERVQSTEEEQVIH
jgi:enoyl reductase-like protein